MIIQCLRHIRIAEWNRQQHALHGNGAAAEKPFDPDLNDDEIRDICRVEEDEMLELEVLIEGQTRARCPWWCYGTPRMAAHQWQCRLGRPARGPRVG